MMLHWIFVSEHSDQQQQLMRTPLHCCYCCMQIREIVEDYPYVAMDTEFPGVVARPIGDFAQSDYQYQTLRCNVDLLKIIQLGLSFANEKGEFAEGCCCWQFNFKFSLSEDMYAQDSIDLLKQSGIRFDQHESRCVCVQ
jgi:CCR4-NOT transcription complex subunit 7/8